MKTRLLVWFSRKLKKNKGRQEYPQTWFYMPIKFRGFREIIQCLCGLWGGHELSETEWGYGGGDFVERQCRWCDAVVKVPKESVRFISKDAADFMGLININGNS